MRAQPLERPTAEQMQRHAWLLTTPAESLGPLLTTPKEHLTVRVPSPVARPASAEASDEEEESAEEEASEEEETSEEASEEEEEAGAEEAASAEAQAGAEDQAVAVMGAGALCMAQLEAALPSV